MLPGPATLSAFFDSGPLSVQFENVASHSVVWKACPEETGGANVSHICRMDGMPSAVKSTVTRQVASDEPPERVTVDSAVFRRSFFEVAYSVIALPSSPGFTAVIVIVAPFTAAEIGISTEAQFAALICAAMFAA